MAAMDQAKLNNMCAKINSSAQSYVSNVNASVKELEGKFNELWVSNSSKELASEISNCISELGDSVVKVFSSKNEGIKSAVQNFNSIEEENIRYSGFSFGKPNATISLNNTLPNGKVGVADGADLDSINVPMTTMVNKVDSNLDEIKSAVSSSDAFDSNEQEGLNSSIERIKNNFNNAINELKNSLSTRMSGEIEARNNLDKTNSEILGS